MDSNNIFSEKIKTRIEKKFSKTLEWRADFQMLFMLKGQIQLQLGESMYFVRKNDFAFIRPYEIFKIDAKDGMYEAYVIEVSSEVLDEICPEAVNISFKHQIIRYVDSPWYYHEICSNLAQIVFCYGKKDADTTIKKFRHCLDIISILVDNLSDNRDAKGNIHSANSFNNTRTQMIKNHQRVFLILQYIAEHYSEKMTLEALADVAGFHPQYFSAYFKKQFGKNFSDYINTYRVNKSLAAVTGSNESILDIAFDNGFNNHKTFNAAFKKVFKMSPGKYRSLYGMTTENEERLTDDSRESFEFIMGYWSKDGGAKKMPDDLKHLNILFDESSEKIKKNDTAKIISLGRAVNVLRFDIRKQIEKAKKDLDITHLRIRDIFSDELFVYYEDDESNPVYSWKSLDEVFDTLLGIGMTPYPEIGYMPKQLASKKQYAGWQYRPNISAPKSMAKWEALIKAFVEHILNRYGRSEISKWYFDFWTAPNLKLDVPYWHESQKEFFEFYLATYRAAKKVFSDIKIGTPNFSYPSGLSWYEDFFRFAKKNEIKPAFLGIHLYDLDDTYNPDDASSDSANAKNDSIEFLKFGPFGRNDELNSLMVNSTGIVDAVKNINDLIKKSAFPKLKIIIGDWNRTFIPTDFARDTALMTPFVIKTFMNVYDSVAGMGFASLSDIHEDFFNSDIPFSGGMGLVDFHGIPKAAYYALQMAYSVFDKIIAKGDDYIVSKNDEGWNILIFNNPDFSAEMKISDFELTYNNRYAYYGTQKKIACHISITARKGIYQIEKMSISREHGSAYDKWLSMGSPEYLSPKMITYLESASLPNLSYERIDADESININDEIMPYGAISITIKKVK